MSMIGRPANRSRLPATCDIVIFVAEKLSFAKVNEAPWPRFKATPAREPPPVR